MAKFQCTICGHIHEGLEAPEKCPVCKAPSSKFTVIDKGAQKATKLQKINDEDYEIIKKLEADGYIKAVEWYQENYDCEIDEAKDAIITIKKKYQITYQGDDNDEIIERIYSGESPLQVVKWYKEKYGLGLKEAKDKIDEVLKEVGQAGYIGKGSPSGNGCMVTILIVITSTLSVLWLI